MRIFLFTLLAMSITANAADWKLIAADFEREYEIDKQSVSNDKSGAWFKFTPISATRLACEGSDRNVGHKLFYVEVVCHKAQLRTKRVVAYSEDGEALRSCSYESPHALFMEAVPQTFEEAIYDSLCQPAKSKKSQEVSIAVRKLRKEMEALAAKTQAKVEREKCVQEALSQPSTASKPGEIDVRVLDCYE